MNPPYYFYKRSLFWMSLITELISIGCSSFLTTCSGHSIPACCSLKPLLLRPLGPSCIERKRRLWRSSSKSCTSSEVRNTLVQGIFGNSLTYISHHWASIKPRALHTLSTFFRTAFRSICFFKVCAHGKGLTGPSPTTHIDFRRLLFLVGMIYIYFDRFWNVNLFITD